ncbi:MAG: twin-arginine translocase TatA/TatE family subunit [Chloroflexi bacterium]|nr:MAG: twin-arginine translocase TatA/TatE family subunit [Chloroflexota bacterium]
MNLGGTELIIILIIVLLLFGVGRVSRIGGELGQAVANFRKGLEDGNKRKNENDDDDSDNPIQEA